jgi:hypothetical protein
MSSFDDISVEYSAANKESLLLAMIKEENK